MKAEKKHPEPTTVSHARIAPNRPFVVTLSFRCTLSMPTARPNPARDGDPLDNLRSTVNQPTLPIQSGQCVLNNPSLAVPFQTVLSAPKLRHKPLRWWPRCAAVSVTKIANFRGWHRLPRPRAARNARFQHRGQKFGYRTSGSSHGQAICISFPGSCYTSHTLPVAEPRRLNRVKYLHLQKLELKSAARRSRRFSYTLARFAS